MLEVTELAVRYGSIVALRGVSLVVPDGATVAILGPNAAGKSTLLNAITGSVPIDSGHIAYNGTVLNKIRPEDIVRRGVVLVPEGRQIFTRLSVEENLKLGARRGGSHGFDQVMTLFPALIPLLPNPAGNLSGGEQQMLAIGRALLTDPDTVLLDEPSLGLAPVIVDRVYEALRELKATGVTILVVEQVAHRAMELADHVYVLSQGRIEFSGKSSELTSTTTLEDLYVRGARK